MCSLVLALTGLTTGLSMVGQYQQSRAQAAAYEAQAQSAKNQAEAARIQANIARQQAETQYQNARIQSRKGEQIAEQYADQQRQLDNKRRLVVAQQRASAGASGIVSGVGSGLDIYNATMDAWENDSLNLLTGQRNATYDNYVQEVNLRNQGNELVAQGENYDIQGRNLDRQAQNYMEQASAAKSAGNLAMFGTLLGGATSMFGVKIGGSSSGGTQTWVGNVPLSVKKSTGMGYGQYFNT